MSCPYLKDKILVKSYNNKRLHFGFDYAFYLRNAITFIAKYKKKLYFDINNIFFILKPSRVANLDITNGMKGQENSCRHICPIS